MNSSSRRIGQSPAIDISSFRADRCETQSEQDKGQGQNNGSIDNGCGISAGREIEKGVIEMTYAITKLGVKLSLLVALAIGIEAALIHISESHAQEDPASAVAEPSTASSLLKLVSLG